MRGMFILPQDLSLNAYELISDQIVKGSPINLGLVFSKYVNKFVTGYFKDGEWIEGKQSGIKRQIYLLREERARSFEELKNLKNRRGGYRVTIKEGRRTIQKPLKEIIDEIIEQCDIDEALKIIKKIQNRSIKEEVNRCLETFFQAKLCLSTRLLDRILYQTFYNRVKLILDKLKIQKYKVEEGIFSLNWRLIVNLGAASVYETSLLFHRNYSVPYIPGSAVKGVMRYWAILKFAEKLGNLKVIDDALSQGKDLKISIGNISFNDLIRIFGTQNKKGEVIFFDALPIIEQNKDFIVLDVMNVHYKPYYEASERELEERREKAPGDWHDPVPVFFLAVEKGTKFRFVLASRNENLVKKAKELLREALENIGVGAKTSAGYGYFETLNSTI